MFDQYKQILLGGAECRYIVNKKKFDVLIKLVEKIYHECNLCERRCGINRFENAGTCGCLTTKIASQFFHYGEEKMFVPSYTIFFSGCNFNCVYCQNWDISQRFEGVSIMIEEMAKIIEDVFNTAKNINWVGGEPTPHLLYVINVLRKCTANIPQIWNSNMYFTKETASILNSIIDIYLTDFKYGNDICAKKLSHVNNYWDIVTRNHEQASKQGEMLIRHLLIPNHINCCSKPIMDWIAEALPNVPVNLMSQYYPAYMAHNFPEINRYLLACEQKEALHYAKHIGLNVI